MPVKRTLLIAGAVYILLVSGVIWLALAITPPIQKGWDEFAKVAGIGLTLVSSVMAAIVSPVLAISQQLHLGRRAGLLEAYRVIYAAISYSYRMLAPLETGDWDLSRFRSAEARLEEAEGFGFFLPDDQEQMWQDVWQKFRYVAESVVKDSPTREDKIMLWRHEAKELQNLIGTFKDKARHEVMSR